MIRISNRGILNLRICGKKPTRFIRRNKALTLSNKMKKSNIWLLFNPTLIFDSCDLNRGIQSSFIRAYTCSVDWTVYMLSSLNPPKKPFN